MLTVHHLSVGGVEIAYELKGRQRDPVTRRAPAEDKALSAMETTRIIST